MLKDATPTWRHCCRCCSALPLSAWRRFWFRHSFCPRRFFSLAQDCIAARNDRIAATAVGRVCLAAIGAPATHVITGTGTSRLAAVFAWVTALTLLGTMALLVPSYGLIGAGVANMTAMSTALIFLLLVRRQLRVIQTPGRARFWMGLLVGMTAQALLLVSAVPYVTNGEHLC